MKKEEIKEPKWDVAIELVNGQKYDFVISDSNHEMEDEEGITIQLFDDDDELKEHHFFPYRSVASCSLKRRSRGGF
jgi:hypothetical protein